MFFVCSTTSCCMFGTSGSPTCSHALRSLGSSSFQTCSSALLSKKPGCGPISLRLPANSYPLRSTVLRSTVAQAVLWEYTKTGLLLRRAPISSMPACLLMSFPFNFSSELVLSVLLRHSVLAEECKLSGFIPLSYFQATHLRAR